MANRRISEFPLIGGAEIDESDLLNLVHVFEVDPVLRNKKITFSGFKDYLNQYYLPKTSGTLDDDITILGNLTVSGTTNVTTITGSDTATFSGLVVQNNASITGTLSGATITGNTIQAESGIFANLVFSATTITGDFGVSGVTSLNTVVCSGVVSGGTSGFIIQGPLVILP